VRQAKGLYGVRSPGAWPSRMKRSFETTFRKLQDGGRARLHNDVAAGELRGFLLPYLGQQDSTLPWQPPDLVRREQVANYPTNFAAMSAEAVVRIATRGEQLTRLLLDAYSPEL
jgi:NTE family protein